MANVEYHPLVAAINLAFCDHRPLVLSPDMLWLLVAQGLASHINANAEVLRPKFVKHKGKATLQVRRDDFIKGSPENPWSEVFNEFSHQIRDHIGAASHDLLSPNFSTTGIVERAAAHVVLLDAMQSFFSYEVCTLCGIPEIILEGTADDWESLAERTRGIGHFGLSWWTELLGPILDEFTAAARGQINVPFWRSIYKLDGGSGGPYATGWIAAFFPYLRDPYTVGTTRKNARLESKGKALDQFLYPKPVGQSHALPDGMKTTDFPSGIAKAPFVWNYLNRRYEMEFLGGFVGVRQDSESLRIRPEIGWAVREQGTR